MSRAVLVLLLLVAGCSESLLTEGDPEPVTQEQLDQAVRQAAQALLDLPEFAATTTWFGDAGGPDRSAWLHYKANGDHRAYLLSPNFDSPTPTEMVTAFVQIDGVRFTATNGGNGAQPWSATDPMPPASPIPLHVDLLQMAETGAGESRAEVRLLDKRSWPNGGTLWSALEIAGSDTVMREWLIDRDGLLVSYTQGFSAGGPDVVSASIDISFAPVADPEPLVAPDLGAPLVITDIAIPENVRRFGE